MTFVIVLPLNLDNLFRSVSHPGVITILTLTDPAMMLPLDRHLLPPAVLGEDPVSVTQPVLDAVWPPAVMSVLPMMVYVMPLVTPPSVVSRSCLVVVS